MTRLCPFCKCNNQSVLARMTISTLLQTNPGYNYNWFYKGPIYPSTECCFVRCATCGFVYSGTRLVDEILFHYYNEGIDKIHSKNKIFKPNKRQKLIDLWRRLHSLFDHGQNLTIKVLDYGAGWGDFLGVAKCIGVKVYGLEFDQDKIIFANNNGIPCGDHSFVEQNMPYDIFMCNQVLEHLDNPRGALQELRNLVKSGAVGYIAVPNYAEHVLEKELEALNNNELPSKNFDPLGHLNYFTPQSFRSMVFDYGFEEIHYGNPEQIAASQARTSMFVRAI